MERLSGRGRVPARAPRNARGKRKAAAAVRAAPPRQEGHTKGSDLALAYVKARLDSLMRVEGATKNAKKNIHEDGRAGDGKAARHPASRGPVARALKLATAYSKV